MLFHSVVIQVETSPRINSQSSGGPGHQKKAEADPSKLLYRYRATFVFAQAPGLPATLAAVIKTKATTAT